MSHGTSENVTAYETKAAVKVSDNSSAVDTAHAPLTRRQKLRKHCTKHWKWYALGTVIFLAILIPSL